MKYTEDDFCNEMWELLNTIPDEEWYKIFKEKMNLIGKDNNKMKVLYAKFNDNFPLMKYVKFKSCSEEYIQRLQHCVETNQCKMISTQEYRKVPESQKSTIQNIEKLAKIINIKHDILKEGNKE